MSERPFPDHRAPAAYDLPAAGQPYTGFPPARPPVLSAPGHRPLTQEEYAAMDGVKAVAASVATLVEAVAVMPGADPRGIATARTHLQTGFMWLNRAIARPVGF